MPVNEKLTETLTSAINAGAIAESNFKNTLLEMLNKNPEKYRKFLYGEWQTPSSPDYKVPIPEVPEKRDDLMDSLIYDVTNYSVQVQNVAKITNQIPEDIQKALNKKLEPGKLILLGNNDLSYSNYISPEKDFLFLNKIMSLERKFESTVRIMQDRVKELENYISDLQDEIEILKVELSKKEAVVIPINSTRKLKV